ncbi:pyrroloquinoline-quinone synthase PqqC [Arcobacter sp. YIC-80]|uniref:pyrroloquinoline-quinone synthase PqqC n=1 Tax=Arcobacter sp. YIC-80 TaxID=3376683 RepID=UPI00384CB4E2
MTKKIDQLLSKEEFEAKLRSMGKMYHIHHPFHIRMYKGECTKEEIQGWVANRFYYQTAIPIKDAAIMSNNPPLEDRRKWIDRIIDHDSVGGGIEAWLELGEAVGLNKEDLISHRYVLPSVKFAVDAYVNFAKQRPWKEAAMSSLTEMFAPEIHQQRLNTWPDNYPWIEPKGLRYFQKRLSEARRDVQHGLSLTLEEFNTIELQSKACEILQFKLDILWTMCDALYLAYELKQPPYFNIEGVEDAQRKITCSE